MESVDFLVVGAGIAGTSAAAELASHGRVLVIEMESQPGYHSTGRSAALFTETYGPPAIRALTAASREFLESPPDGFAGQPILGRRGVLLIGRGDQRAALDNALADGAATEGVHALSAAQARTIVPVLRPDYVAGAILEPDAMDIDVHALHGGFLKLARARGATLRTDAALTALERTGAGWRAETAAGPITAGIVVNAAGAWADAVAGLAGLAPLGLVPKRRTAVVFEPAEPVDPSGWPLVCDVDENFYVKPESGRLLASPADATPSPPCDTQPEELDIARALDRVEKATTLAPRRVTHRWAGLRSFFPDGVPAVGLDPRAEGFLWVAGQGGYGIQTSPAMGRTAAALALGRPLPDDIARRGLDAVALSPARLVDATVSA